jgi:hypothetical protein
MVIWIHHHASSTILFGKEFWVLGEFLCHSVATNQWHGPLIPTSSPNIYKVFENIHMLWTLRLIHNHAISTILFGQELQELEDFLCLSVATNDGNVLWLKPQTHLEWFQFPD